MRRLFLALAAACAACASVPRAVEPADARVLVGHGDGATAAEAHAAALADLAAQVRASVSSRTRRFAQASSSAGRARNVVETSQEIEVDARLAFAELARRRRLSVAGAGRVVVTLTLERRAWAARRRAGVATEARRVVAEVGALGRDRAPSASRWQALARAVAAARAWQAAEAEAAAVDPGDGDATGSIARALAALIEERDRVAAALVCVVQIEGDETLQAIARAACGGAPPQALLGPTASDARRLVLRGRVERTVEAAGDLVFAQSRAVLTLEGDGRTLETLIVGGPRTRRGHLDAARAIALSDDGLRADAARALEARFR